MNELTKQFIQSSLHIINPKWTIDQKADELAMFVIVQPDMAGVPDLIPELSIDGGPGVDQHDYDMAVEGAFSFMKGEIKNYLEAKLEDDTRNQTETPILI